MHDEHKVIVFLLFKSKNSLSNKSIKWTANDYGNNISKLLTLLTLNNPNYADTSFWIGCGFDVCVGAIVLWCMDPLHYF